MIKLRPGQQIKIFQIVRTSTGVDSKGKATYSDNAVIGELRGTLSNASQQEQSRWKQMEHPISHTIVVRGRTLAQAEDVLTISGRRFYVQGVNDPNEMGIFTILYCDERTGM